MSNKERTDPIEHIAVDEVVIKKRKNYNSRKNTGSTK